MDVICKKIGSTPAEVRLGVVLELCSRRRKVYNRSYNRRLSLRLGVTGRFAEQPSSELRVQLSRYGIVVVVAALREQEGGLEEGPRLWTLSVSLRESA